MGNAYEMLFGLKVAKQKDTAAYLGSKFLEGLASPFEGLGDLAEIGLLKLSGGYTDEKARNILTQSRTFVTQGEADLKYDVGKATKIAGDVSSGIGQSLPMLAVAAATGGAGAALGLGNVGQAVLGGATTFLSVMPSATGNALSEVYQKTGKLDDNAWKYGLISGTIEGATEVFVDPFLGGTTKGARALGRALAGDTAKSIVRKSAGTVAGRIAKSVASSFASEAVEEGVAGVLSPIAWNIIYKDAISREEVSAESLSWQDIGYQMLVGGLSGALMGGAQSSATETITAYRLGKAYNEQEAASVLSLAGNILSEYDKSMPSHEALQQAVDNYRSAKTDAQKQARLNEIRAAIGESVLGEQVSIAAAEIRQNAEAVADKVNRMGYLDEKGNKITITAKELRADIDSHNLGSRAYYFAVLSAAGKMFMDVQNYEQAIKDGEYLGTKADVANFIATATPEQVQAVNAALGVDVTQSKFEDVQAAFVEYVKAKRGFASEKTESRATATEPENAQQSAVSEAKKAESDKKSDTSSLPKYQRESVAQAASIPKYADLNASAKAVVRSVYVRARTNGYSEADAKTLMVIAARSGVDIEFVKDIRTQDGKKADGFYDRANNRIVVNLSSSRALDSLLLHELTHYLETSSKYRRLFNKAVKGMSAAELNKVVEQYGKVADTAYEVAAHYTEKLVRNKGFLAAMVAENNDVENSILNHFKRKWGDERLDRNAKKYAKEFKAAFDEISERNAGTNALKEEYKEKAGEQYALPDTDSDGTKLSAQQVEFFKDSKVVDEQGRLKVVYHGTRSVFTQFSRDRNYFTDSQEVADSYAPAKIKMTGYLDIKKPFIIDAKGERWSRIPVTAKFKKLLDRYGGSTFYEDGKLRTSTADIAATIMDIVDDGKADYDGIIIKNVEDVGQYWTAKSHIVANDYIVFSSEQFKLTTNKNPTSDKDIRYALSRSENVSGQISIFEAVEENNRTELHNGVQAIMETIRRIEARREWYGGEFWKAVADYPAADFIGRIARGDETVSTDLADVFSQMTSAEIEKVAYYLVEDKDKIYKKEKKAAISSFKKLCGIALRLAQEREGKIVGRNLGIKTGEADLETIKKMFYDLNTVEELNELAEKVFSAAERLDIGIGFRSLKSKNLSGGYVGGEIRYDTEYFNKETVSDNRKAQTILHEMIHACTSYAIVIGINTTYELKNNMDAAIHQLYLIWQEIKDDPNFYKDGKPVYGTKNVQEMVAELANPDFRARLRKKNLLQRIIDAIKNFFGIEHKTAFDTVSFALDYMLDNFDRQNYNRYLDSARRSGKMEKLFGEQGRRAQVQYAISSTSSGVRFALPETDSDGASLSNAQREYFKNTKVLDKNGKLLVVYHGTNADFTVFDHAYIGEDNKAGYGFYFTLGTKLQFEYEHPKKCYLNIEHPLYDTEERYGHVLRYQEDLAEAKLSQKEIIDLTARKYGIDGIINRDRGLVVAYYPEQIKLTTNKNPTTNPDVRYALYSTSPKESAGKAKRPYSKAQLAKFIANATRPRVYSRTDAESVINTVLGEILHYGKEHEEYDAKLHGQTKEDVIEYLFRKLNSVSEGYRMGVALNVADYIIDHAAMEEVMSDYAPSDEEIDRAKEIVRTMNQFRHRVDFRHDQGEIKYRSDKDANTIRLHWAAKFASDDKVSPDLIAESFEEIGVHIEATQEMDIFYECLEKYNEARKTLAYKADKIKASVFFDESQKKQYRTAIAQEVLKAYAEKGQETKFSRLVSKYVREIDRLRAELHDAYQVNRVINDISYYANVLKDIAKKHGQVSADSTVFPALQSWIKRAGDVNWKGQLRTNAAFVRQVIADAGIFYNKNNRLIASEESDVFDYIDDVVVDAIEFIKDNLYDLSKTNADGSHPLNGKPLSYFELQAVDVILKGMKHLYDTYDTIFLNGKKQKLTDVATSGYDVVSKTKAGQRSFIRVLRRYLSEAVEPRVVIEAWEHYDKDGALTKAWKDITDAETKQRVDLIRMVAPFEVFFDEHKGYEKRLAETMIPVGRASMTVGQAISLYELSKREQAKLGLQEAGITWKDAKGNTYHLKLQDKSGNYDASIIKSMETFFTEEDRAFIEEVENFFNKVSKETKQKADLEILGYTNVLDEFYFPIARADTTIRSSVTDIKASIRSIQGVYSFSFNKDTRKNAKNELQVNDVFSTVWNHATNLSIYANMTVPIKNFDLIYNKNIGTTTDVKTIRKVITDNIDAGAHNYLRKLMQDLQGNSPTGDGYVDKLFGWMRGKYATFQLGANLKVILSQTASYPTAFSVLDAASLLRAFTMKPDYEEMSKYSEWARARYYTQEIVKAESVGAKIDKIGELATKPIQWTDHLTIAVLWNACKVQAEKNGAGKIGTEANYKAAAELLEDVGRKTQPNYTVTERSGMMRSSSEFMRSITMFTAVPLKQLSRLVEATGKLRYAKSTGDKALVKEASEQLWKSTAAITTANIMYCLIGAFFSWFFKRNKNKKGEEIPFWADFGSNLAATTVGMLPIVRNIYDAFARGFDFSGFNYDMFNELIATTQDITAAVADAVSGTPKPKSYWGSLIRKLFNTVGEFTGIPTKNVSKLAEGVLARFAPSVSYRYDSFFYNANYAKDLRRAIEKGDEKSAKVILDLMMEEDVAGEIDEATLKIMTSLYEKGYDVIPQSVGSSVTYTYTDENGETHTSRIDLTAKTKKAFQSTYGKANGVVSDMIGRPAFLALSDDMKAKAIKYVYKAYYDEAKAELTGTPATSKLSMLSSCVETGNLSVALSGMSQITTDKDKNGKTVSGSKKKKTIKYLLSQTYLSDGERLLLLAAQGYKIGDGDYKGLTADQAKAKLLAYLRSKKGLSEAEKQYFAELCGFKLKNGKFVP